MALDINAIRVGQKVIFDRYPDPTWESKWIAVVERISGCGLLLLNSKGRRYVRLVSEVYKHNPPTASTRLTYATRELGVT